MRSSVDEGRPVTRSAALPTKEFFTSPSPEDGKPTKPWHSSRLAWNSRFRFQVHTWFWTESLAPQTLLLSWWLLVSRGWSVNLDPRLCEWLKFAFLAHRLTKQGPGRRNAFTNDVSLYCRNTAVLSPPLFLPVQSEINSYLKGVKCRSWNTA